MENFTQRNVKMSQSNYKNLVISEVVKDRYMLYTHCYYSQISFPAMKLHSKKQKQTKHCMLRKKKKKTLEGNETKG